MLDIYPKTILSFNKYLLVGERNLEYLTVSDVYPLGLILILPYQYFLLTY